MYEYSLTHHFNFQELRLEISKKISFIGMTIEGNLAFLTQVLNATLQADGNTRRAAEAKLYEVGDCSMMNARSQRDLCFFLTIFLLSTSWDPNQASSLAC
jgi:hypothetical protein